MNIYIWICICIYIYVAYRYLICAKYHHRRFSTTALWSRTGEQMQYKVKGISKVKSHSKLMKFTMSSCLWSGRMEVFIFHFAVSWVLLSVFTGHQHFVVCGPFVSEGSNSRRRCFCLLYRASSPVTTPLSTAGKCPRATASMTSYTCGLILIIQWAPPMIKSLILRLRESCRNGEM